MDLKVGVSVVKDAVIGEAREYPGIACLFLCGDIFRCRVCLMLQGLPTRLSPHRRDTGKLDVLKRSAMGGRASAS